MSAARTTCCRPRRTARFASGLAVYDFLKRTTLLGCDRAGFARLAPAAAVLARAEGLEAHALAVERRLGVRGMSDGQDRIAALELDQKSVVRWSPQVEHERDVAIFDLLEDNHFRLVDGVRRPLPRGAVAAREQPRARRWRADGAAPSRSRSSCRRGRCAASSRTTS